MTTADPVSSDLITSYCSKGGKDLGEFFLGSQIRTQMNPPPEPKHCIGQFEGLMQQMGGEYSEMCRQLGMAPRSFKRMIEINHIEKAFVIETLEANLGIEHGTKQDAALWYLARGNKALPPIDDIIATAQWRMSRRQGAETLSAARDLALQIFDRSGYTHEKLGDLTGHPRLMNDIMQNKDHHFDTMRAEALARAILSGEEKEKVDRLTRLLLGHAAETTPDELAAQHREGKIDSKTFLRRLRAQAHLSQQRLAKAVNTHAREHGISIAEIGQSHIAHWEAGESISKLPLAHALGTVLGLSPQNLDLVPCLEKDTQLLGKEEWLTKIRNGEITFTDYLKEVIQQEKITQEAFATSVVVGGVPTTWPTLHRWMEGKRVEPPHAAALAERMGYDDPADKRDFIAFARTGLLHRSDLHFVSSELLLGKIRMGEVLSLLRAEEGQSPEEFDQLIGLSRGLTRNLETGKVKKAPPAAADLIAGYLTSGDNAKREALRACLILPAREGSEGGSHFPVDGATYRAQLAASCSHVSLDAEAVAERSKSIRFELHDAPVELWWRTMAAEHMEAYAKGKGETSERMVEGWNDLHDLLFSNVHPARLRSPRFKENVETIALHIGQRQDHGTARIAMLATVVEQMHDRNLPEQCDSLAHFGDVLMMEYMRKQIGYHTRARDKALDTDMIFDQVSDKLHGILLDKRIDNLATMPGLVALMITNKVRDANRTWRRHIARSTSMDGLENHSAAAVMDEDPFQGEIGRKLLALLDEHKECLTPNDIEMLAAIRECGFDERGLYTRVAEHLGIPTGTVRSRIFHLRESLLNTPEIAEKMADLMGKEDDKPAQHANGTPFSRL